MTARKENHKLDNRNITNFARPEEQNITYIMISSKDSFTVYIESKKYQAF